MDARIHQYLTRIGRAGGRKSKRKLSPEQARRMVRTREAKRLFFRYRDQCFWSFDPMYKITTQDIEWVADQLKRYGDREAWKQGASLCR